MAALQQVRPFSLFTDEQWGSLTRRSGWRGIFLVAHAWALIAAASALVAIWPNPVTWLIAVMVVGARQLGLAILMHEAAHGTLHPNTAVNAFLGEYLCAAPGRRRPRALPALPPETPPLHAAGRGSGPRSVRAVPHHARQPAPEDHARSDRPDFLQTAHRAAVPPRCRRQMHSSANRPRPAPLPGRFGGGLSDLLGLRGLDLVFCRVGRGIRHLVPAGHAHPQHRRTRLHQPRADPYTVARTTKANWLERLLIAPYYVHYHAEHHLFIAVPCYRLPRLHQMLAQRGLTEHMNIARGYLAVLGDVAPAK
jgi:hypothetical protein